jgi:putative protease
VKPELLAPGGSFLSAYYAFQAGADGVYLGMKEFSARKAAANFTPAQLRRLLGIARQRGGRVYLALNTVVREQELLRAAESLHLAQELGLDGVIVQDLGIAELARRHFPSLALHASTQMAVHNAAGLRAAKELGFRRVILARELDLETIRGLREANPDIELEVFIHGALCYSFSGLCLASWALTGRSGNRGDCAQICRSRFRLEDREGRVAEGRAGEGRGAEGYFFSSRDLYLGPAVRELAALGIDALKIEGRMKSPEYVFYTVKLYRAILDRGEQLRGEELAELERSSALGFARERTPAYLRDLRGERLIDADFPGHRGAALGTVQAVRDGWAALRLEADLSLRDGLQYFEVGGEPIQFSVRAIRRGGREIPVARRGESVEVQLPVEVGRRRAGFPVEGQPLFQLSSRSLDLPQPREGGFRPFRVPCPGRVELSGSAGAPVAGPPAVGPAVLRVILAMPAGGEFSWQTQVPLVRADTRRDFASILAEVFVESGDCLLTLARPELDNRTGLPDDALFVPPSALKKARAAFYRALADALEARRLARLEAVARDGKGVAAQPQVPPTPVVEAPAAAMHPEPTAALLRRAARRQDLSPLHDEGDPAPHPFVGSGRLKLEELASVEGYRILPLPPVARAKDPAGRALELIEAHPEERFVIGLSNLAHLELARRLAALPNVRFFADFPLYAANRFTVDFLARKVPGLLFVTHWLEDDDDGVRALETAAGLPLVRLEQSFQPPLFYGMGCPRGQGSLPVGGRTGCRGCPGGFDAALRQGRTRFLLRVRDCIAYLYAQPRRRDRVEPESTPSGAGAATGTSAAE